MGYAGRVTLCNAIFDVPAADYGRSSRGVLIGSGAGVLMAVMDAAPCFRFAVDVDQCRGREDRLRAWLRALDRNGLVDRIAVCGWFSITDPKEIAGALAGLSAPVLVYAGAGLGREVFAELPVVDTLDEFLRRVAQPLGAGPRHEGNGASLRQDEAERPLEPFARMRRDAIDDLGDADHAAELQADVVR
jgi:hypothetical protein